MPNSPYVVITGYKETAAYLQTLAEELRPQSIQILAELAVQVMKESEPPQNSVSRADAYPNAEAGPGWQSDRQRRFVMARISSGEMQVPYSRTGAGAAGWHVEGSGENARAVNGVESMKWTQSPTYQSAHEKMVGWLTTTNAIHAKMDYILSEAQRYIAGFVERTFQGRGPLT